MTLFGNKKYKGTHWLCCVQTDKKPSMENWVVNPMPGGEPDAGW